MQLLEEHDDCSRLCLRYDCWQPQAIEYKLLLLLLLLLLLCRR
jgi:hypothetical protein